MSMGKLPGGANARCSGKIFSLESGDSFLSAVGCGLAATWVSRVSNDGGSSKMPLTVTIVMRIN